MTRSEFLNELSRALGELRVPDRDEIVAEYEEHFEFKLSDGYGEEEIAGKLGAPAMIARQFAQDTPAAPGGKRAVVKTGLVIADIFVSMFYILLAAWVAVAGAAALSCLASGVCLIARVNLYGLLPQIPYISALLVGFCLLSLSALAAVGTWYCAAWFRQLLRAYIRWHKNTLGGGPAYPPLAKYPQLGAPARRRQRRIVFVAVAVFAVTFVAGYIVSALLAGAVEFWHVWHWFV